MAGTAATAGSKAEEFHLPRISDGFNVTADGDADGTSPPLDEQSRQLVTEVLQSHERVARREVNESEEVARVHIAQDLHIPRAKKATGTEVLDSVELTRSVTLSPKKPSYGTTYTFLKPKEFWEVVWMLQKDETTLREMAADAEHGARTALEDDYGGGAMAVAASTVQRAWRCHAARETVRKKTIARNAEEAVYNPLLASSTVQFQYPQHGQPAYEVPRLTNSQTPTLDDDGGDLSISSAMQRVKAIIARFGPEQNAHLYEYTRVTFPMAIEVDPAENIATINLYALDPTQLELFNREAVSIYYQFPSLGSYSAPPGNGGTLDNPPPMGPVPTDEASIVKREVLAKRIADLTPENQKTLIMHLRRLAPHVIKVQDGVGMVDTADLDEWRFTQSNLIVLELLQMQRDQNVDIRDALEAERLRIAKEREELELQREREEAGELKRRRDIMDKAWLQEQQIRDYEERQLLLRMRQQEELDRKRLAIEQEKRVHEERLKWEQAEYAKMEASRQQERDAKFKLRQQLNELEKLRSDQQRQMDIQQREYQRRLRQLELREREIEFERNLRLEEEKQQLGLSRASLQKELALLTEPQHQQLAVYVKDVAPYALDAEDKVVPEQCFASVIPCILMYAVQLRLGRKTEEIVVAPAPPMSYLPKPPSDRSGSDGGRPSRLGAADMQIAAAPLSIQGSADPSADQTNLLPAVPEPTMDDRYALSLKIGKLAKGEQRKLCEHLQAENSNAIFHVQGRTGVDTAHLAADEFWVVDRLVQTMS